MEIRDVSFSSDGSLIAITTSDSILLYDVTSEEIKKLYSNPVKAFDRGIIYAYSTPVFSPDNTMLLVNKGYYEGASQALITVKDGSIRDLPYSWYGQGKRALNWISNDGLLVLEFGDGTSNDSKKTLHQVKLSTLESIKSVNIDGNILDTASWNNDTYIFRKLSKENGKVLNNVKLYDEFDSIVKVNLTTLDQQEIYNKKIDENNKKYILSLRISPLNQQLYITYTAQKNGSTSYAIYSTDIGTISGSLVQKVYEPASLLVY